MSRRPHDVVDRAKSASPNQSTGLREGRQIRIRGLVQGVGFRPFVYRLARQFELTGSVRNSSDGVIIEAHGGHNELVLFQTALLEQTPPAAAIEECLVNPIPADGMTDFTIEASTPTALPRVRLPHDLATCPDCLRELRDRSNRRHNYPFTNCVNCGPRYTAIETLPYDRPGTSMRHFVLCRDCTNEYQSPHDRRFHAQTNACIECGPQVALWDENGKAVASRDEAMHSAVRLLRQGRIVAVKGLGGFQLLARADDNEVVTRLRRRKNRPMKPLAVMVCDLEMARGLASFDLYEQKLLSSAKNPIVLLERLLGRGKNASQPCLAETIAPNAGTIGLFLPTTPLHHLLLAELKLPVIATSANHREEPIVIDESDAVSRLHGIADAFLVHDRPIVRRLDDSVVRMIGNQEVTIRLARGYAPLALVSLETMAHNLRQEQSLPAILAAGGHQKNAVAAWTGTQAVLAQHLGDLDYPETRAGLNELTRELGRLFHFEPRHFACDLHPDYYTTQWTVHQNWHTTRVQHHHAHALACQVEFDLLDREVLAFCWDGTGFGPDGTVWGGETLLSRLDGYQRVAALLPFPLPGGEAAIRYPQRIAFGMLFTLLGHERLFRQPEFLARLGMSIGEARVLAAMISKGVNCPWTSSVGRLFDAVAALVLGIREATYEGEAAVWLEAVSDPHAQESYELPLLSAADLPFQKGTSLISRGDWRTLLSSLLEDLEQEIDVALIGARFHNALARWAATVARHYPHHPVVLGGGCFQNRLLTEKTVAELRPMGRTVHHAARIPPGDGGLAVGQLAAALGEWARRRVSDG